MTLLSALLGTLFTWAMTAAGASLVFVFPSALRYRSLQQKLLDGRYGEKPSFDFETVDP
jgi:hypothetical protein